MSLFVSQCASSDSVGQPLVRTLVVSPSSLPSCCAERPPRRMLRRTGMTSLLRHLSLRSSAAASSASVASTVSGVRCAVRPVAGRSLHLASARHVDFRSFDEPEPQPKQSPPVYDHKDTPGSEFKKPEHLRRRDVAFGIGTPAEVVAQGVKPRRHVRPYGVQGIRTSMRTYVEGPRELGHKVSDGTSARQKQANRTAAPADQRPLVDQSEGYQDRDPEAMAMSANG